MSIRDDFLQKIKDTLAKRVAYKCSNPMCRKTTIGPNSTQHKSTSIGIACHICAAAEGGPRYDSNMSSHERSSIENGIWLCSNCSSLVDKDADKYPILLLKNWKFESERMAEIEISSSTLLNKPYFVWESNPPIVNKETCKYIKEHPIDYNLFKNAFNSLEQKLDGKQTLIINIWKFMNTPKYEYKIYSDMYGTEYSEFLNIDNEKTFLRLAPLIANEIIFHPYFKEWVSEIYGIKKDHTKLFLDFGIKGNRGKIITVNLLWKSFDLELLSYES